MWIATTPEGETIGHYISDVNMLAAMRRRLQPGALFVAIGSRGERRAWLVTASGCVSVSDPEADAA